MEGNPNPKQQFPTANYNPPWLTRRGYKGGEKGPTTPPFVKGG